MPKIGNAYGIKHFLADHIWVSIHLCLHYKMTLYQTWPGGRLDKYQTDVIVCLKIVKANINNSKCWTFAPLPVSLEGPCKLIIVRDRG